MIKKKGRLWQLAAITTILCIGLAGCSTGEDYKNMEYDANNLGKLTNEFFLNIIDDDECVKHLDNMTWQRSGGKMGSQLSVILEYDNDGYNYNFLYVDKTDNVFPYHLTVRVHTVKGYKYLYSAALHGNQFGEGIGEPTFDSKWKAMLDDDVREGLDRVVPESEQQKWNKKVLEEYTGILQCFFNEQHAKK